MTCASNFPKSGISKRCAKNVNLPNVNCHFEICERFANLGELSYLMLQILYKFDSIKIREASFFPDLYLCAIKAMFLRSESLGHLIADYVVSQILSHFPEYSS